MFRPTGIANAGLRLGHCHKFIHYIFAGLITADYIFTATPGLLRRKRCVNRGREEENNEKMVAQTQDIYPL